MLTIDNLPTLPNMTFETLPRKLSPPMQRSTIITRPTRNTMKDTFRSSCTSILLSNGTRTIPKKRLGLDECPSKVSSDLGRRAVGPSTPRDDFRGLVLFQFLRCHF